MGVCDFITRTTAYAFNGRVYRIRTLDFARWSSYQTYLSPFRGSLPVCFILEQWGWETQWGGLCWSKYFNPGAQGSNCGVGEVTGWQPPPYQNIRVFRSIRDGVMSYTNLLIKGYPHVQFAYRHEGSGQTGIESAFRSLGRGYHPSYDWGVVFCGYTGVPNGDPDSPRPSIHLWDRDRYDDGGGPGSSLVHSYNFSGNQCLRDHHYVQMSDPRIPGFANLSF